MTFRLGTYIATTLEEYQCAYGLHTALWILIKSNFVGSLCVQFWLPEDHFWFLSPCHSWSTPKIDLWFPRHFWSSLSVVLILAKPTARTLWAYRAHSRIHPPVNTSQKNRNDIVGVSFIESKLAIPISLLMFSPMVVPVALVSPLKVREHGLGSRSKNGSILCTY
jgi:hypothetical protein